ncbi:MAG: DUF2007 domain-containing protein [Chthoniobacterales bacterium]|nr:DUF2007 domain-containing protein [Chthoniobacterales bacterium]
MITVRTFSDSVEAGLAKSVLDSAGIASFLHGENTFQTDAGIDLVLQLQVPEDQAAEALLLLNRGNPKGGSGGIGHAKS